MMAGVIGMELLRFVQGVALMGTRKRAEALAVMGLAAGPESRFTAARSE